MQEETVSYDSLEARPLPKWLTDQRDGLNSWQPPKMEMKKDASLTWSIGATGILILLVVTALTFRILRRNKKKKAL